MTDSFAGISMPEGSVSHLRHAGSRLAQQAQVLAQSSQSLRAMPASAGSWTGPAHGAYANRCITASTAATLAAQSFILAAGAAEAYADELEDAKREARDAIRDAQRAQEEIDRAQDGIETARGRQQTAQIRIDAALHAQAVAAMSPAGDGGAADAMLSSATAELHDAQEDERRWAKRLREAKDDLRDAKRRGERAEQRARDAAQTAQTIFAAAGSSMPILAPPPAPVSAKAEVEDTRKWYEKAAGWTWDQVEAVPGAAKDATVSLATGLANEVGNAAEYNYNRVFHPELAMRYEMERNQAFVDAVTDPIGTGKRIINWDDLSNGRIGEWIGGFAPDAAFGALTAGGGYAVRATRGTQRVSEMPGDKAAARAQENFDRARSTHAGLEPPSAYGSKTVAATKQSTLSGWIHRDLDGIEYVRPEEVHRMAKEMDFDIRGAGAADHAGDEPGFRGKHHASHAEAQQLARHPGQPVGVDRPMCGACQDLFRHAAHYSQQPLLVQDPDGSRLFLPNGEMVRDPDISRYPDPVRITPADMRRGAGGAGAAALAGSQTEP